MSNINKENSDPISHNEEQQQQQTQASRVHDQNLKGILEKAEVILEDEGQLSNDIQNEKENIEIKKYEIIHLNKELSEIMNYQTQLNSNTLDRRSITASDTENRLLIQEMFKIVEEWSGDVDDLGNDLDTNEPLFEDTLRYMETCNKNLESTIRKIKLAHHENEKMRLREENDMEQQLIIQNMQLKYELGEFNQPTEVLLKQIDEMKEIMQREKMDFENLFNEEQGKGITEMQNIEEIKQILNGEETNTINKYGGSYHKCEMEIQEIKSQFDQVNDEMKNKIQEYNTQAGCIKITLDDGQSGLENELKNLENDIDKRNIQIECEERNIELLKKELVQIQSQNETLIQEKAEPERDATDLQKKIEDTLAGTKSLQFEQDKMLLDKEQINCELVKVRREVLEKDAQLRSIMEKNELLKANHFEKLRLNKEKCDKDIDDLNRKINEIQMENKTIKMQIDSVEAQIKTEESKHESILSSNVETDLELVRIKRESLEKQCINIGKVKNKKRRGHQAGKE